MSWERKVRSGGERARESCLDDVDVSSMQVLGRPGSRAGAMVMMGKHTLAKRWTRPLHSRETGLAPGRATNRMAGSRPGKSSSLTRVGSFSF